MEDAKKRSCSSNTSSIALYPRPNPTAFFLYPHRLQIKYLHFPFFEE
jgi:hypothetical protein